MVKKMKIIIFVSLFSLTLFIPNYSEQKSDKTYDQLKLLVDILTYVQDNYVEETNVQELIYGAASGMLKPLDPYTQFMEPDSYKEMKIETEGKYGGLGIRITIQDNWLTVVTPLLGTPAYRLGILPGDKIIKIDGESTSGITITEAVKKLRGQPGTKVTITIAREGLKDPVDYTIVREIIKIETSRWKLIDNIGYIRLYEFNSNSLDDMKKALNELTSKNIKGLILDLRNNPGGLLDSAVDIVRLFLGDNKLIVSTKGRIPQSNREYYAMKEAPYEKIPLVVLTNKGSASGSEIVAGALQDHKRAIIIGSRTFGKASVQSVLPLDNGCGLRLTTAKYYTPSGRCIHKDKTHEGGIEPDIKIELSPEIEAKLYQQQELIYPEGKEPKKDEKKEVVSDIVLERAVEILKARDILLQTQQ
jgi:carboxyl-terminal processing protease